MCVSVSQNGYVPPPPLVARGVELMVVGWCCCGDFVIEFAREGVFTAAGAEAAFTAVFGPRALLQPEGDSRGAAGVVREVLFTGFYDGREFAGCWGRV